MGRSYVYILASRSRVLYVGVTADLASRVSRHQQGKTGFISRYGILQLVYFEESDDVRSAIAREKQIKGWKRARKLALVESVNPEWRDLSQEQGFFLPMKRA